MFLLCKQLRKRRAAEHPAGKLVRHLVEVGRLEANQRDMLAESANTIPPLVR